MPSIAIFASGTGSNALKIIQHFQGHPRVHVTLVLTNKAEAGVLKHARDFQIPSLVVDRDYFYHQSDLVTELERLGVDLIILAGFLWLIPSYLIQAFPDRIVNIHPALLPKFGGKGMYGMNVHRAVKAAGESSSGITIHYVDEHYDEGQVIFQTDCFIEPEDSPEVIAKKVLALEHQYFSEVIETLLQDFPNN